jgi:hypothetical protein
VRFQPLIDHPGTIDDTTQSVGHHCKHGANSGKEKNRSYGELDRGRDLEIENSKSASAFIVRARSRMNCQSKRIDTQQ